ncbi:VWA domain-containing protein [Halorubrum sp. AJ67]|uniref:VWA domain-containing protein n=1 Tax=Halorubrum sp. AJ67 TaxID=1173487 RepID=UPI0003DD4DA4|nr:VWA domain-containing protein [Halorubrum sp. AJ67]CDK38283.1 hypothetical protein BN903_483 [Halorubrum sp. AJ67]
MEVRISENVATAAVVPASTEALVDGDQTEFSPSEASNLVESVDADYIVLVTGKPAPLESVCLNDQLTADSAYQFGLAIHETLHILKTAFGALQSLTEEQVDPAHREFVHELINITEDGAIENEAITGEDFSQRSANRLTLINEALTQKPAEYPEDHEFSFGDALLKGLHDRLIYDSGVTDLLLDETDTQFTFATDADRKAFAEIDTAIDQLATDIISLRSDATADIHHHDKAASIKRIKRTIRFWNEDLKPLLADQDDPESDADANDPDEAGEAESQQSSGDGDTKTAPGDGSDGGPSLETTESGDSRQSVDQYPTIGDEPDPDDVDEGDEDSTDTSGNTDTTDTPDSTGDPAGDSPASEPAETTGEDTPTDDETDAPDTPEQTTSGQASLTDFGQNDDGDGGETAPDTDAEGDSAPTASRDESADSDTTAETPEAKTAQEATAADADTTSNQPPTDGERQDSPEAPSPVHDSESLSPADFESDRQQAAETAADATVDEAALERDLQTIDDQLAVEGAGQFAAVEDLDILPEPDPQDVPDIDWPAIEQSAALVGDTLAKELRLDQQTNHRDGLSSGSTINVKTAYRLGYGDPRTFTETLPGNEKDYFLVLILDRSASMGPSYYDDEPESKISVATNGVARFALACESLDIDVAIIDFYRDDVRLVKPPAVETEFASEQILSTETGGKTPLAEALSLARTLADSSPRESLIISMTDDKPSDIDAVASEIAASYDPVCSLTIATDCKPGHPPEQAETLLREYDQTTTVYDPSQLESRLDELASLLSVY